MSRQKSNFSSFLWAGFECTAAKNEERRRMSLLFDTKHDVNTDCDYQLMKDIGITTVREGLNWSYIDKGRGVYDFSLFEPILKSGVTEGIQQVWDLNHFDFPDYLEPFGPDFPDAFAAYAMTAIEKLREYISGPLFIVPINEISFFSWIGADRGVWAPYRTGSDNGFLVKKKLVAAVLKAVRGIREIDSEVQFIHSDPFMRRVPRDASIEVVKKHCDDFNNVIRLEAWDMLYGKTYPEIGGSPDIIDYIGVNYYIHNQEWVGSNPDGSLSFAEMPLDDPGRVEVSDLLSLIVERYEKPLIITETGSYAGHRKDWWSRVLAECLRAKEILPLEGVCAYPILDRPDWSGFLLPQSGLWDFDQQDDSCARIPHSETLDVVREFQRSF